MLFAQTAQFWYSLPLALTISLVYSATRFEDFDSIMKHSFKSILWLGGFAAVVFCLLRWVTWPL